MFKRLFILIFILLVILSIALVTANIYLKPFLEEKFLDIAKTNLGAEVEMSGFDVDFLRGIVSLQSFKVKEPKIIGITSFFNSDKVILDIALLPMLFQKKLVFEEISFRNPTLYLKNELKDKEKSPAQSETVSSRGDASRGAAFAGSRASSEIKFDSFFVRKLRLKNSRFIFEDCLVRPSPVVLELVGIEGTLKEISVSLSRGGLIKGIVDLKGKFNSVQEGFFKVAGSLARDKEGIDFDLEVDLQNINLIRFRPYYSQTSFAILKDANVNLHSKALCKRNDLNAIQHARIYDIVLEDIRLSDEDRLFGLPAKTVIDFFMDLSGDIEFDFKLVGAIHDPKFDPGPLVKQIISKALQDKIIAKLRELPREVIKISEKAIRESLEGEKELEEIERELKKAEKKLKKIIGY